MRICVTLPVLFARHGRALTGESPEYLAIDGTEEISGSVSINYNRRRTSFYNRDFATLCKEMVGKYGGGKFTKDIFFTVKGRKTSVMQYAINNNVRKLRNNLNMTQATFAEYCDVSIISISRYESGERISARNAEKIANACHVSLDYVLGQEKQPPESNAPNTVEYDLSKEEIRLLTLR